MNLPAFQYVLYLATLTALVRFPSILSAGLGWILVFLVWNSTIETIGFILDSNYWLYNLSTIVDYAILTLFFYTRPELAHIRKILVGMYAFYLCFSLININFIQGLNAFDSYSFTISCFFIDLVSAYFFYRILIQLDDLEIYKKPGFWIVAGLVSFYTCCFPIFGLFNYMRANYPEEFSTIWSVIPALNLIQYLFFIIGFLCLPISRKLSTPSH